LPRLANPGFFAGRPCRPAADGYGGGRARRRGTVHGHLPLEPGAAAGRLARACCRLEKYLPPQERPRSTTWLVHDRPAAHLFSAPGATRPSGAAARRVTATGPGWAPGISGLSDRRKR